MVSAAEQLAANLNFGVLAKAEELKTRIWCTLGALLVSRSATSIPLPGIAPTAWEQLFTTQAGGILGDGFALGDHRHYRLTPEVGAVAGERIARAGQPCGLGERQTAGSVDSQHAWTPARLPGIDVEDVGVRLRTEPEPRVRQIRDAQVPCVRCVSGDLGLPIFTAHPAPNRTLRSHVLPPAPWYPATRKTAYARGSQRGGNRLSV